MHFHSSTWFLDSGSSFHMTPHLTQLSSMSVPSPPHIVQTAYGTSLPIAGWGILSSPSFYVPSLLHVPKVTLHLMFVVILLIMVVIIISFLKLTLIVFRIFVRGFWWGLGLGIRTLITYGSLIGYVFHNLLSIANHLALLLLSPLLIPLPLSCNGIIIWAISQVLDYPN
jgi:hypothetical protein